MRRTARLLVVILALAAGGLLWKGDVPDLPDPESPHFSLNPPGWDPDPEYETFTAFAAPVRRALTSKPRHSRYAAATT